MYLKSLVLKGFKSFADRSVLKLEPGMTVVVGPNGSGKSNISDAVLWVLGEQSAKQLRGQAMQDVIFAGSSARQAVGLAEVDLVLDNSDGTLPLDFAEVAITRRMYRNGESEYLINGAPSRLMDVADVLNDCGLGRDTHSIISQGSLAGVLRARPEDRRVLIEEAAGILKHKKRKERSGRKLEKMDAELARVHDVQRELERQLKPLERQASKARRHEQLAGELKDIQLVLAVDDLRALQGQWEEGERQAREADAQLELERFRYDERSRELEKYQRLLEEKGLFVGDLAEQRRRCQSVMERLDAGMLLLEEKGRNMVARLSELRQSIHRSSTRSEQVAEQLAADESQLSEASASLQELTVQLEQQQAAFEQAREQHTLADEEATRLSARLRACERDVDANSLAALKARESLSASDTEDGLLANREQQVERYIAATNATLEARRARLSELEETHARLQRDDKSAQSAIDACTLTRDEAATALERARRELGDMQAELAALREVEAAFDEANPMLQWSHEHADAAAGALAPLREVLSAPAEFEPLVELLLGADVFGVMMQDARTSGALAEALATAGLEGGEMTFMPLEGTLPERTPAAVGDALLGHLSYDTRHERVVRALLGDVFVVDDVSQALAAARDDTTASRFATRDGIVVWPNGKVTVGSRARDAQGVLARTRRAGELADALADAQKRIDACQGQLERAREELQAAQDRELALAQNVAAASGELESVREEIGRLGQSVADSAHERDTIRQRRSTLAGQSASARQHLADIEEQGAQLESEKERASEELSVAREHCDTLARQHDALNRSLMTTRVELATVRERVRHMRTHIDALRDERDKLAESLRISRETERSLEILRLRVEPLYEVFSELREHVTGKAELLRDKARLEQAGQGDLRETIESVRAGVAEAQQAVDAANETLTALRIEKSKLEVKVEQAVRVITEEYGVLLDIALETPAPENRGQLQEKAGKLQRRLNNLGAVNPVAVEEYRSLKERRDFMAVQVEDLEAARTALQRIVAAIERKMRNRFLETFEQVNANFEDVFAQLFPGGQGHLELTDPSDPEHTGVEVHAQPRGKAVRKQTLLSGGEQSLVALALMFSVYKVRSTPFYILDEVEAALDDTNLRRLLAYLDSIRDSTQFIIISHQRRTMEMADVLYGVSMRGDGVSKLVSQKLDQAIRLGGASGGQARDIDSFSGAS